ncbi:MAG: TadE/TadG family type IV pilus assembly protein [Candidatus Binataceae bacterium]
MAAIEFGVVGSVLILLMVMATDLGLVMQHRSQMEGAVRAGLQKALDQSATLAAVEDYTLNSSDLPTSPAADATAEKQCGCPDGTEVSCTTGNCGAVAMREYVALTLEQDHNWLLGFPGLPNPTTLSITRTLRVK